jgi:hypothetical protein
MDHRLWNWHPSSWEVRVVAILLTAVAPSAVLAQLSGQNGSPGAQVRLVVQVSGQGAVTSIPQGINCFGNSGTCSWSFPRETQVQLVGRPASGWRLIEWRSGPVVNLGCPEVSGPQTCPTMVVMPTVGTATWTASFGPIVSVRIASGNGRVTSNPRGIDCLNTLEGGPTGQCTVAVPQGASVTLIASYGGDQTFLSWRVQGASGCSGTDLTCQVHPTAPLSVLAYFGGRGSVASGSGGQPSGVRTYQLSVAIVGGGYVTSAPSGISCGPSNQGRCVASFPAGTSVVLSASTNLPPWRFLSWSGACVGSQPNCPIIINGTGAVRALFVGL